MHVGLGLNMISALPGVGQSEQAAREKQQKHSRPSRRTHTPTHTHMFEGRRRSAAGLAPACSGAPPGAGQKSPLIRVGSLNASGGHGSEPRHRCRSYTSARRGVGPSGGSWEVWATGRTSTWEAAGRGSARRPGLREGEASGLSVSWRG